MLIPGRTYSSTSSYRYGFNGKENDNEVKGEGDQQDYGMRIYDPRLGRFFSVDPLHAQYPQLTPYQFASNRPIDGVDLDGLEYLTAIYDVTIKGGQITLKADYVWYNSQRHNQHGPLGQGVNYNIYINDLDNKTRARNKYFVSRGGNSNVGSITQYGNYMGSAPLPNFNAYTGAIIKNTYRYDIEAVDYVDQQAKLHDQGYDRVKSVGASGLFDDWATTPYDEAAANSWASFYDNFQVGAIDPFNNQRVSSAERDAAWRGKTLFGLVIQNKKWAIAEFMKENYKDAKQGTSSLRGRRFSESEVEANYQMFLEKYMQKDKDGNWIRNDSMWNKDKKGNYTTPKTNKQLKNG